MEFFNEESSVLATISSSTPIDFEFYESILQIFITFTRVFYRILICSSFSYTLFSFNSSQVAMNKPAKALGYVHLAYCTTPIWLQGQLKERMRRKVPDKLGKWDNRWAQLYYSIYLYKCASSKVYVYIPYNYWPNTPIICLIYILFVYIQSSITTRIGKTDSNSKLTAWSISRNSRWSELKSKSTQTKIFFSKVIFLCTAGLFDEKLSESKSE